MVLDNQLFHLPRLTDFILFQAGCIPNLTYDVLQKITTESFPMQYPLNTLFRVVEAMKQYGKGLQSFVGLPVSYDRLYISSFIMN